VAVRDALAVFACPRFSPAATQMIEAAVGLPGLRLAVVSNEPQCVLPSALAASLAAHWQVDDVTNPEQLEQAVLGVQSLTGGLPVSALFGAYEQLQEPLARVRERLGIDGMRPDAARRFRDKDVMKQALRRAGIPCARAVRAHSADEALAGARTLGYPLVAKPVAGAGARHTERITNTAALAHYLQRVPVSPNAPVLLEELLVGREYSMESITIGGRTVWQSHTRYAPSPLEVLEHPWMQWCVLLPREQEDPSVADARAMVSQALVALGMETGVSHAEWFRRSDGSLALSEIAARPPGAHMTTLIARAHDVDFVKVWAAMQIHGALHAALDGGDTMPPRRYAVGAAYLRAQGHGSRITHVHGVDQIARSLGALITDARLPVIGDHPTGSYEGDGVLIVRHPETAIVEAALQEIVSTVRVVA